VSDKPGEFYQVDYDRNSADATKWERVNFALRRIYTRIDQGATASGNGGVTDHSKLTNLGYSASGHTGFAPTAHSHIEGDVSGLVTDLAAKTPNTRVINTSAPLSGGGDLSADRTLAITKATAIIDGYLAAADFATFFDKQNALGFIPENITNKGAVSGYAPLDASSKVPTENLGGTGADNTKYLRGDQTWAVPSGSYFIQTFTSQTSVTVIHNLGSFPVVQIVDDLNEVIIPKSIVNNSINDLTVNFSSSTSGSIILTLGSSGGGGGGAPFALSFNATTDWGTASGGYYIITVNHNIGSSDLVVEVWDTTSGMVQVLVDQINQVTVNQLTLRVPSSPDKRFAGKIVVSCGAPAIISSLDYSALVLASNPLCYWRLGELTSVGFQDLGSAGLPLSEESGVSHLLPGLIKNNIDGAAYFLSSTPSYARTASTAFPQLTTAFTFEVWVNIIGYSAWDGILGVDSNGTSAIDSNSAPFYFLISANSVHNFLFKFCDAVNVYQVQCPETNFPNVTYHVVAKYNGATLDLFVNGMKVDTLAASSKTMIPQINRFVVGCDYYARVQADYANAVIDEVAVYNTALSDAVILSHYKAGVGMP
jgi:hypothetical protein